jgi:hypothetical protein
LVPDTKGRTGADGGNRVLKIIFGPKRDELRGGWIKLHNEELHDLYTSPSVIRIIE